MQLDGHHLYVNDGLSHWLFPFEFNFSITPVNTPSFFTPRAPIKLNSLHPHSHIHELLAPPPPPGTSSAGLLLALAPLGRRPLLPPASCSVWASSSLMSGGELPRQGSSTWAVWSASGRAPPLDLQTLTHALKVAAVTRYPPHLPGQSAVKSLWRWQQWCGTVRRWRGGN
jgi:hypothetical protein